ncbi:hypothetical protein MHIMP23_14325 [Methylobacterium hispanicum]|jgi:hypothetical protein|uniref:Uncharacterized protein n=1 Tax=Methylobacterium hispanicum TaxID=270350 RepID=A0AAV4ZV27_9HYPH|nr:hypothetical protein [Methylobacterium hispanicum]GJD92138.1 hypothetical protein BHAOGJBA_5691 [Methylobacterium hispanicum]
MCAGRGSGARQAGYGRRLPEVHFRSRGPRRRAANENRQAAPGPVGLALSALRLATLSTAALAVLALRLLPSS